jgi:hypothetical protein
MHAHGRTLRQWGDLRLVAVPAAGGGERYYVAQGGRAPLGTFAAQAAAVAFFEALRAAEVAQAEGAAPGGPSGDLDAAPPGAGARRVEDERLRRAAAAGVTDLAAYRRARRR